MHFAKTLAIVALAVFGVNGEVLAVNAQICVPGTYTCGKRETPSGTIFDLIANCDYKREWIGIGRCSKGCWVRLKSILGRALMPPLPTLSRSTQR